MKTNVKDLMPFVEEEIAKGRNKMDVYKELGLSQNQIQSANYYLRKAKEIEENKKLIFAQERVRFKKYITIHGKRYEDITADFIDCGG